MSFNYKSLIKSRNVRIWIMSILSFVPDKIMLKIQYKIKTGRKLNLTNPQRYTEKLQYYKLNYRNPLMKQCANKYEVRKYVIDCGLEHILNDLIGVYDSPNDIKFEELPNQFVAKDNLGGGGNSVLVCLDKDKLDIASVKNEMKRWCKRTKGKHPGREWVYDNQEKKIVIEKYLSQEDGDLPDYKFFCFNGKVVFSYLMENYSMHHDQGRLGFFDKDFNLLPYHRKDFAPITVQPEKPKNYEKMVEYAEILSKNFPHVRVDFYNIDGKIYFGELTFFMASGYLNFEPDEFDFIMGKEFDLSTLYE